MAVLQQTISQDVSQRHDTKIALCWINLGPYHVARAQALSRLCDLSVIELARFQRQYGWDVNRNEIEFEIVTLARGAWEDQGALATSWHCWKQLSRLRPDILLVPGYANPAALTMAVWGCLHRVPRILMSESTAADRVRKTWKEKAKGLLIRTLYSAASFGGKPQLRYLRQLGFSEKKSAPYYNVVDNEFFTSATRQVRGCQSAVDFCLPQEYFLYVGRLAPEKNLSRLLHAFAKYRQSGGAHYLILAGDGPLRLELSAIAHKLAIEKAVRFAGGLDTAGLIPFYAFAKAFVLPSLSEPWGLVVNEAMASSLPVLVSTKCGCAEDLVIEGKNGFLFDPDSEEQIANCLSRISSAPAQDNVAMRSASLERIKEYSPSNWASAVMNLIGTL